MLNITIKTIPHNEQRYETIGDYQELPNNKLLVTVSDMGDTYKELLVAVHELCEYYVCRIRGIEEPDIAAFDKQYEVNRAEDDLTSEPGDDPKAPYRREHRFAENIERQLCHELGLDWGEYEKTVYSL
jgi:hypothetical protein